MFRSTLFRRWDSVVCLRGLLYNSALPKFNIHLDILGYRESGTVMSQKHLMFVYGTLKKDQPNHYVMESVQHIHYIQEVTTMKKFPLVIAGPFNLPMLLNVESTGKNVKGELYEVDDEALTRLDDFEGHPTFYERLRVEVAAEKGILSQGIECWTYFIKEPEESYINLPHLESYDTNDLHGLPYDTSENDELETP